MDARDLVRTPEGREMVAQYMQAERFKQALDQMAADGTLDMDQLEAELGAFEAELQSKEADEKAAEEIHAAGVIESVGLVDGLKAQGIDLEKIGQQLQVFVDTLAQAKNGS